MQIDFRKLMIMLMPLSLRKPLIRSFLIAIGTLFNQFLSIFSNRHKERKKELAITPQVCYLEKALNDRFDSVGRHIRIEDAHRERGNFYFRASDNKDWYHQDTFYVNERQLGYDIDFVVICPAFLQDLEDKIKAFINQYKLIGKKYIIIYE